MSEARFQENPFRYYNKKAVLQTYKVSVNTSISVSSGKLQYIFYQTNKDFSHLVLVNYTHLSGAT